LEHFHLNSLEGVELPTCPEELAGSSCDPPNTFPHETALRNLLDVQICELRYTDLDWAVERLEQLSLTGR